MTTETPYSEDVQILVGLPSHGGDLVLQIRIAGQATEVTMTPAGARALATTLLQKAAEYDRFFPGGPPPAN
ncbi:MAG: hypothetical protein IPM20_03050 [Gammaproteobacteria bacterium]|nr:hypothetical protein [Gammaproteobacteria bacterium]